MMLVSFKSSEMGIDQQPFRLMKRNLREMEVSKDSQRSSLPTLFRSGVTDLVCQLLTELIQAQRKLFG